MAVQPDVERHLRLVGLPLGAEGVLVPPGEDVLVVSSEGCLEQTRLYVGDGWSSPPGKVIYYDRVLTDEELMGWMRTGKPAPVEPEFVESVEVIDA